MGKTSHLLHTWHDMGWNALCAHTCKTLCESDSEHTDYKTHRKRERVKRDRALLTLQHIFKYNNAIIRVPIANQRDKLCQVKPDQTNPKQSNLINVINDTCIYERVCWCVQKRSQQQQTQPAGRKRPTETAIEKKRTLSSNRLFFRALFFLFEFHSKLTATEHCWLRLLHVSCSVQVAIQRVTREKEKKKKKIRNIVRLWAKPPSSTFKHVLFRIFFSIAFTALRSLPPPLLLLLQQSALMLL